MPGFAAVLTEPQVVDLVAYLRAHFTSGPAWDDIAAALRRTKSTLSETTTMQEAQRRP
jgi:hypothetical protein